MRAVTATGPVRRASVFLGCGALCIAVYSSDGLDLPDRPSAPWEDSCARPWEISGTRPDEAPCRRGGYAE
jgi:hypothetical protein